MKTHAVHALLLAVLVPALPLGAWAQSGGTVNAGFLAGDTEVYTPVGVVDEGHFAALQPAFAIQPAEGPATVAVTPTATPSLLPPAAQIPAVAAP